MGSISQLRGCQDLHVAKGAHRAHSDSEHFLPIPVGELELLSPDTATIEPNALGQISLLVRVHGVPIGVLSVLAPQTNSSRSNMADAIYDQAEEALAARISEHLAEDGLEAGEVRRQPAEAARRTCAAAPTPSRRLVTVVVCTLGEDQRLIQTVRSILAQTHAELELIVVDNNPGSGGAGSWLADFSDPRLRIVPEPRRGLSAARNAGLHVAAGSVIAYTDDDAYADSEWIRRLVAPFDEHEGIVCVTGLVLPAELATVEQVWFEEFGAFDKGFDRTVWSAVAADVGTEALGRRGHGGALFPYSAGIYGSGNNMAFRSDWLRGQRLFDTALGAGTLARGGEDLDAFLTAMLSGGILIYEPRAIVKHYARSDMIALRQQMYGYGSGLSAVMVKHLVSGPKSAVRIISRLPRGLHKLLAPTSEKNAGKTQGFPQELSRAELAGFAAGPVLYLRSRWRSRGRMLVS